MQLAHKHETSALQALGQLRRPDLWHLPNAQQEQACLLAEVHIRLRLSLFFFFFSFLLLFLTRNHAWEEIVTQHQGSACFSLGERNPKHGAGPGSQLD